MKKRRRDRWLREDTLAPWLAMGVILGLWWVGARTFGPDRLDPPFGTPSIAAPADRTGARTPPAVRDPAAEKPAVPRDPGPGAEDVALVSAAPIVVGSTEVEELVGKRLLLPVAGVERSALRSTFVEARGGGSRQHEAIDILAPRGTTVYATSDGRIAKLFTSAAGGLTVYQFDPTEQYAFYYAHLDAYAPNLAEGQFVSRGQTLGYVGTTGNAPPNTPHLHFAIFKLGPDKRWWEGEPIDPFLVLSRG